MLNSFLVTIALIPACDEDGGPGRRISEDLPQIDIDVFYEYSNDNLSNIKVYTLKLHNYMNRGQIITLSDISQWYCGL